MDAESTIDICKRDHLDVMIRYGEEKRNAVAKALESGTPLQLTDKRQKILGSTLMMLIKKRDYALDAELLGEMIITQRINELLEVGS